jgi:hypothetical protein
VAARGLQLGSLGGGRGGGEGRATRADREGSGFGAKTGSCRPRAGGELLATIDADGQGAGPY